MAKPVLISPISKQEKHLLRVAAYCRVSSCSEDQRNSYATQISYYTNLAEKKKSEWTMVEIFADEGISGMTAQKRPEFQKMIRMCELHQIDLIITKSVSRFARNVKEALEYIRKLKHLGVGVQFEKEGINTLSIGDEMLLNTFSAIAQEESKSISQNQRLSIVKRMELGEYTDSNAPYGFRLKEKVLVEYTPESDIVRWMFNAYLSGMSTSEIANELTNRGVPTKNGKKKWKSSRVSYILANERYIGDCFYQKTYRDTTVPFKQYKNRGEEDRYYATGTHKPIVKKDVFDKVQQLAQKRKKQFAKSVKLNIYPLTSHIQCKECGSFYRRKIRNGVVKWVCAQHEEDAKSCNSRYYSEEQIYDGIISMINKLRFSKENILGKVIVNLEIATERYKRNNKNAMQISQRIAEINATILKLNELRSKGYIAPEIHYSQIQEQQKQLNDLKDKRQIEFSSRIFEMLCEVKKLKSIIDKVNEPLVEFDINLFKEIVTEMSLSNKNELTITLIGGLKYKKKI